MKTLTIGDKNLTLRNKDLNLNADDILTGIPFESITSDLLTPRTIEINIHKNTTITSSLINQEGEILVEYSFNQSSWTEITTDTSINLGTNSTLYIKITASGNYTGRILFYHSGNVIGYHHILFETPDYFDDNFNNLTMVHPDFGVTASVTGVSRKVELNFTLKLEYNDEILPELMRYRINSETWTEFNNNTTVSLNENDNLRFTFMMTGDALGLNYGPVTITLRDNANDNFIDSFTITITQVGI